MIREEGTHPISTSLLGLWWWGKSAHRTQTNTLSVNPAEAPIEGLVNGGVSWLRLKGPVQELPVEGCGLIG